MTEAEILKIETAILNNPGFVISIILGVLLIFLLFSVFIFSPFGIGKVRFFNKAVEDDISLKNIFYAFINGAGTYFNILRVTFMKNLLVVLWTLLGFVPLCVYILLFRQVYLLVPLTLLGMVIGIYKSYQYFVTDYIVAANPDIKWKQALKQSKGMVKGKIFYIIGLKLSFIGWYFLGMFFGPIGIILVSPYVELAFSVLYFALKGEYVQENEEKESI